MSKARACIVNGGNEFLSQKTVKDCINSALKRFPDAQVVSLDAAHAGKNELMQASSPSLLSDKTILFVDNIQNASESAGDFLTVLAKQSAEETCDTILICRKAAGIKGKRLFDRLKKAGAAVESVTDLKKAKDRLNFVFQCFENRKRRVNAEAAQLLVSVLGEDIGQLYAMCCQLCFDFDENPVSLKTVESFMTAYPSVTGFNIADRAMAGDSAGAIAQARTAVKTGTAPVAIIAALAMNLRLSAQAAALHSGALSRSEIKSAPWQLEKAQRNLRGWNSETMSYAVRTLAWADEQNKAGKTDSMTALEYAIETIALRGRNMTEEKCDYRDGIEIATGNKVENGAKI